MIHIILDHPITVVALATFLFAIVTGGTAERLGAAAMVSEWMAETAVDRVGTFHNMAIVPTLCLDFTLALSLLMLALRFGKLWLGSAMILQSMMLAMHSMMLSDDAPGFYLYAMCLNMTTCLVLFSLVLGTVSVWRNRNRADVQPRPGRVGSRRAEDAARAY